MPNGTVCQLVKLPVVVGETVGSVTVDNVTCPPETVKKVDHIDVVVRDLEADPVFTAPTKDGVCNSPKATVHFGDPQCGNQPREIRKINIHGTVHKQIYYVDKNDDVRHMSEDIDFTKTVTLSPPLIVLEPQNVEISFRNVEVNVSFDLPRPSRIQQVVDVSFTLKIVEQTQLYVSVFPNGCEPAATLGIQDEAFEEWLGNCPVLWQCDNVCPSPYGRTGQAAQLGCCPTLPAAMSRTIPDVLPGAAYELTFWARSVEVPRDPCHFTMTAQIQFLDAGGNPTGTAQQTVSSQQLNDTYRQFRVNGTAPAGTAAATVSFTFTPQPWNTCAVLIDDLSFGQVGGS
ncbi:hypothetical protein JCM39194_23900 [Desulfotomaculum varum]